MQPISLFTPTIGIAFTESSDLVGSLPGSFRF